MVGRTFIESLLKVDWMLVGCWLKAGWMLVGCRLKTDWMLVEGWLDAG